MRKKQAAVLLGAALVVVAATLSRGAFKADLLPEQPGVLLADDASPVPRYTESGQWDSVNAGFAQRQRTSSAKNAKATWLFSGLPAGRYEVWVTWTPGSDAADARFSVKAADAKSVTVNQRQAPQPLPDGSNAFGGLAWQSLGTFNVQSAVQVEVSQSGKGRIFADAVILKPLPPPSADLWAGAEASSDLVRPGTALTFSLSFGNEGPETSEKSTLTFKLPNGLHAGRQADPRCAASGDGLSVTCRQPKLAKGERKEFSIAASVDGTAECGSTLIAWATASGTQPGDAKPENNASGKAVQVRCGALADVSVGVTADASVTSPNGRLVLYTVTLTNNGPDPMEQQAVLRIEKLGDDAQDFRLYSGDITPGCNGESCTIPGGLGAGQSATASFIGAFRDDAGDCGKTASTRISVTPTAGQTEDPVIANDAAQTDVTVSCDAIADVTVALDADRDTVQTNTDYSYTVSAANAGPDEARDVQVLVQPPRSTWFVYDRLPGGCSRLGVGDMVVCTIPSLAAGQSQQLTLPAHLSEGADCPAERVAQAFIGAGAWDRDAADNNHDDAVTNCE